MGSELHCARHDATSLSIKHSPLNTRKEGRDGCAGWVVALSLTIRVTVGDGGHSGWDRVRGRCTAWIGHVHDRSRGVLRVLEQEAVDR